MNAFEVMRALGALAFVLALIALGVWVLRRYSPNLLGGGPGARKAKRLEVLEITSLDHRRKLALIRRDDKAHLLVLSPTSETVIETGIDYKPETTDIP